ncbi:MAG: S9 family peptidase [Candidatus Fermentibacteraceae bacterium]|nr:S9 family peptidase [Candidatus Fermentibacteraceae bacterium]MBN2609462.1 S9 family peptidase [Candidatus Fermentibacteraceae bacterium]
MHRSMILVLIASAFVLSEGMTYPDAPSGNVVDDYFGIAVPDPYRWLEDVDSEETVAWVEAQKELWESYLDGIPVRDSIRNRLEELYDYERHSMPFRLGERYFFYINDGLQEQSVLCWSDSLNGEPHVLLDPNGFEGERLSLASSQISDDGELLAWAASESGSDWMTWYFMEIGTGRCLEDTLRWSKSMVEWNDDNSGFYYSAFDEPEPGMEYVQQNRNERVLFHRLGTPQAEDILVYERPDKPDWMLYAGLTHDDEYLVIWVYDGNIAGRNGIFYIDLNSPEMEAVELLGAFDASYNMIGNIGDDFYVQTDLDAPNCRLIKIDISAPERENWVDVVPESDEFLTSANILNNSETLVLQYSMHAYDHVRFFTIDGRMTGELELPGPGTVWGFGGFPEDTETFYYFNSLLHPGEIYRYDLQTDESRLLWAPEIDADLSRFEERQVFYESFDGTMIPMFITYPGDVVLDGANPTLLYGYGGFGVPMSPWFSASTVAWLEMGGVYAMPCIRGGGEYGEEWHLAGIRENRPVVFRDFIAAAEYLIDEGYTSRAKIAISGASNGGTLVAAVLNMRPDLFGAAAPAMGVLDLMRFHLFTVGWSWISEYGNPDDPEDVEFLLGYSPYQNIRDGVEYPAVLISTADHDDRVVPGHSFKYGARLQAAQSGDAPILMSITSMAGHGGAVGLSESLDRVADEYAFFWKALKM